MQKLSKRHLSNTPTDTSLVRSNCDCTLNSSEGRNSEYNLKTFDNDSEVNQLLENKERRNSTVSVIYVLNRNGVPLMPCSQKKAKNLLRKGEAIVVKRTPFTIKLKNVDGGSKQNITLGVDIGYKNVGVSATTETKELYAAEIKLRTDIVKLNSERRMYRRTRRNRNHWYRPARFLNRKKSEKWIAPSIQHKIDSHLRIIDNIKKLLPISKIIIEVAKFNIQKIKNPEIKGAKYQQGEQLEFYNVREYVIHRDGHQCSNCGDKKKFNVHHIESRMIGGDAPNNLITLCEECHQKHHNKDIKLKVKRSKSFKTETCMNIIRNRIVERLKNVEVTYGYITKFIRKKFNIEKSHINDAFVISSGSNQSRILGFTVEQRRKNNRCLQISRKGFGISIRKKRYELQPMSLVKYLDRVFQVIGTHCKGSRIMLRDIKNISVSIKKVQLIKYSEGLNYV